MGGFGRTHDSRDMDLGQVQPVTTLHPKAVMTNLMTHVHHCAAPERGFLPPATKGAYLLMLAGTPEAQNRVPALNPKPSPSHNFNSWMSLRRALGFYLKGMDDLVGRLIAMIFGSRCGL